MTRWYFISCCQYIIYIRLNPLVSPRRSYNLSWNIYLEVHIPTRGQLYLNLQFFDSGCCFSTLKGKLYSRVYIYHGIIFKSSLFLYDFKYYRHWLWLSRQLFIETIIVHYETHSNQLFHQSVHQYITLKMDCFLALKIYFAWLYWVCLVLFSDILFVSWVL